MDARRGRPSDRLLGYIAQKTSSAWATKTRHRRSRPSHPHKARADHLVVATANVQYQQQEAALVELVKTLREHRATAPAILALQEVQGHDDGEGHTIYQIADLLEMSMRFAGARRHPLIGPLRGSFGNAVLACAGFGDDPDVDNDGHGVIQLPGGWEPRVAVDVRVPLDDGSAVRVMGAHLDHGGLRGLVNDDNVPGEAQLEKLIDSAERDLSPTVICGDFNLTPDVVDVILRGSRFVDPARGRACHAQGTAGKRRIDYILVDDRAFDVVDIDVCPLYGRAGRRDVSDHHAVVAILKKKTTAREPSSSDPSSSSSNS